MKENKSHSVGNITGVGRWLSENYSLFMLRIRGMKSKESELMAMMKQIDEFDEQCRKYKGSGLDTAKILEIGYGSRPNRLIALMSLGYDVMGIDLDKPMLNGSVSELLEVYHNNGFKRALKSFIRNKLFDKHERRILRRILSMRGSKLIIDNNKFKVGDAASFQFEKESIDFIYSWVVFEHIPPKSIHEICTNLSKAIAPDGVALITPEVYTGIGGGHLVEWYPSTSQFTKRRTEPWEHLRKRRVIADCYLNELRVDEYTNIFNQYFKVVDLINIDAGIGKEYLTKEIRKELSAYDEEELLSKRWTYVLQKKD